MSGEEHDGGAEDGFPPLPRGPSTGAPGQDPSSSGDVSVAVESVGRTVFVHPRFDPSEAFIEHHEALREALLAHPYLGVLACVANGERLETTWIAATEDEVRAAIVGRHSRATLALPRDHATAALRHMALLVRLDRGRPVARVLDLQTEIGFADPLGRRFEAVRTDGCTFLSAGGAVLMLLPTGPDQQFDQDAEQAWSSVPPRRWLESRVGRQKIDPGPEAHVHGETLIQAQDGPRGCRARLCRDLEIPVGILTVAASGEETNVRVSGRALDEGFLIGRYDRCEVGGPEADESLSRVHLLIVREGPRIIAIDTASTNGTYVGDDRVHLVELVEQSHLDLGGVLDLTWRTCN